MRASQGNGPTARSQLFYYAAILAACNGGGGEGGGGGCGGGSDLVFTDENNYTFASGFETVPEEVQAQSNVTIDWSALTTDIRGREFDPTTVDQISLLNITAPREEVYRMIAENEISQDDAQDIYLYEPEVGQTSAELQDFTITDIPIDLQLFTENDAQTWILSLMDVPDGRTDILATAILQPKVGATDTRVDFTDGISELTDLVVDISGAAPLVAKADSGPYGLDWSAVTVDTFGHPFDELLGDELLIGHWSGDVASIESDFLRLDGSADALYRLDVFGTRSIAPPDKALEDAVDADGKNFPGFTAEGTWLVGIVCRECPTPVPLILGHVQVEE